MTNASYQKYKIWDMPTLVFHRDNFITILSLLFIGLIMPFKKAWFYPDTPDTQLKE